MKVLLISDTHGLHKHMNIDTSVDMIVSCGDESDSKNWIDNEIELNDFVSWFTSLDIQYKVMIAGNHSAALTKKYNHKMLENQGIIYLEDNFVEIEGKIIFGSPWSPSFNDWHFMKSRSKLGTFWDKLLFPGIDLLVTHTPPKGILDLSYNKDNSIEMCGCNGLMKAVKKYKPRHHSFGHIHSVKDINNFGTRILGDIQFHNASAVKDGDFDKPPMNPNGIIIEL